MPETRMTDAVKGYRDLATELATRWGKLASSVAAKIDADQYDAEAAHEACAKAARLTADTGGLLWFEALDAISILSGRQYAPYDVDSDPFESTLPGATLELEGPLIKQGGWPLVLLFPEVRPPDLPGNQTEFTLHANAKFRPGGTYIGKVRATKGGASESIDVWITVA